MPYINLNSCNHYYVDMGTGKETIVFSHGLLWDHSMFQPQLEHFAQSYRVIAYDHRGQGKSEVTDGGYDMDQLYRDALQLLDALNLEKVHFVGLSMGGFVGMRLAARDPDRVQSLILMETSAEPEPNKIKYSLMNTIVKYFGTGPVVSQVMNIMFGKDFLTDPERKEQREKLRHKLKSLDKSIIKAVEGVIHRKGVVDELHKITCPTLVMVGDQDVATVSSKAETIHRHIHGSTLEILEGAGHTSSLETPQQVIGKMEKFLNTVSSG